MKIKTQFRAAFSLLIISAATNGFAEVFDTGVSVNGTSTILNGGDTYNISSGNGLAAYNNGTISVTPSDSGINVNLATQENPASSTMRGVYIQNGGNINLGSGSKINGYNVSGTMTGLTINGQSNPSRIEAADALEINIQGSGSSYAVSAYGTQAKVDLGSNAKLTAETLGFMIYDGAAIGGTNAAITSTRGNGAKILWGFTDLNDSTIIAEKAGFQLVSSSASAQGGATSYTNIHGGSVFGKDSVFNSTQNNASATDESNAINHVATLAQGANAESASGILFQNEQSSELANSSVTINVEGNGTKASGVFLDTMSNQTTTLNVSNSATWASEGSSHVDKLVFDNANIELTLDRLGDAINAGEMSTAGISEVVIDFSNDFLNEISNGFIFDTDTAIIIGSGEKDNIEYIVAGSNKDGSTWTVTDNGDGTYTITDINVIPEPATCAAVAGALALMFAAYRRRK